MDESESGLPPVKFNWRAPMLIGVEFLGDIAWDVHKALDGLKTVLGADYVRHINRSMFSDDVLLDLEALPLTEQE